MQRWLWDWLFGRHLYLYVRILQYILGSGLTLGKYCVSRLLMVGVLKYLLLSELLGTIRLAGGVAIKWTGEYLKPLSIPRSRTVLKKKVDNNYSSCARKWMYGWNDIYATFRAPRPQFIIPGLVHVATGHLRFDRRCICSGGPRGPRYFFWLLVVSHLRHPAEISDVARAAMPENSKQTQTGCNLASASSTRSSAV